MGQKRRKLVSSEERLQEDQEFGQAVSSMVSRIIAVPGKRVDVLVTILRELQVLKEPELSDKMDVLKSAVKKGFMQDELRQAVEVLQSKVLRGSKKG